MKKQRFLAALLSVALLVGAFTFLTPAASAAEEEDETLYPLPPQGNYEQATELALNNRFYEDAQAYLDDFMQLRVSSGAYQLYANPFTGEVALKNRVTGQILSTNPYQFGDPVATDSTGASTTEPVTNISEINRQKLLSQILISYTDETGAAKSMNSFNEAASYGQIYIRDIKNGVRVEYIIGRLDTNYLLPGYIMADRFESQLLEPMRQTMIEQLTSLGAPAYDEASGEKIDKYFERMSKISEYADSVYGTSFFAYNQMKASYTLQDPNANISPAAVKSMQEQYPITGEKGEDGKYYAIYTLSVSVDKLKTNLEGYVKGYCPEYGYDDLEADHEATRYEAEESDRPVFRLSLEYILNEDGMSVRLPAGGIRYDETLVTLDTITINPYFGAADMADNDGYIFFPDGTGSIMEYKDLYNEHVQKHESPAATVYGKDYAYYDIEGSQHQESVRMPVYGSVDAKWVEADAADAAATGETMKQLPQGGYLAIVTEGDALTEIVGEFGGIEHNFASAYSRVTPRPTDEYTLENSISATGSGDEKWTVVSERKYTGNYTTKIVMLTDSTLSDQAILDGKIDHYYRADWIGMAKAYREYLEASGVIDRLTDDEVKDQLPLYIESFGSIETTEKFLSMPITVDVALTSFDNVQTMYENLSDLGIKNVNFRLVGFANGGMDSRYPVKLDWEDAVGGEDGFEELLEDAKEKGYGVYPDFDFLYISETGWFDGISTKKAAVRTVDDRYASKQIYDAVYQDFFSYYEICVASSQLSDFYKTFAKQYGEYADATGLSLALFGDNLNSNFDEDDPTTRADAQKHYTSVLAAAAKKYSVMSEGGNIFTTTYVDHMLNAPIESSNFNYASHTVPFYGMVLHGYINMAGSAFNEAGDVSYNIMRSIENGMAPYYILSFDSDATALLKQDTTLSKYYSIRYDIWLSDGDETDEATVTPGNSKFVPGELIKQYELLNAAIGDLQTSLITDHQFLITERVRTEQEVSADREALIASITRSVASTAYNMEATQIRLFRRELNIFTKLAELGEDMDAVELTAEEIAAIQKRIVDAANNTIFSSRPMAEKLEAVVFDASIAKATRDVEALRALYMTTYYKEAAKEKHEQAMELLDTYFATSMYEYLVNEELTGGTIGQQEDVDAAILRFVVASHNTYFGVEESEKLSDLPMDILMAGAIFDKTARENVYRQEYYPLSNDSYTDEEKASRVKELNAMTEYVDAYIKAVAVDYSKRFDQGETFAPGKTVGITVDVNAVVAQLVDLVGDSLTKKEIKAAVLAADCEKESDDVTLTVSSIELDYLPVTTESLSTDSERDYHYTGYSLSDGRAALVTYTRDHGDDKASNDEVIRFALNYNLFDVEVRYLAEEDITISFFGENGVEKTEKHKAGEIVTIVVPSYGFVRID